MKTILILAVLALASRSTTTPPEWDGTNPLDTPGVQAKPPESEGNFGHEWMYR